MIITDLLWALYMGFCLRLFWVGVQLIRKLYPEYKEDMASLNACETWSELQAWEEKWRKRKDYSFRDQVFLALDPFKWTQKQLFGET